MLEYELVDANGVRQGIQKVRVERFQKCGCHLSIINIEGSER